MPGLVLDVHRIKEKKLRQKIMLMELLTCGPKFFALLIEGEGEFMSPLLESGLCDCSPAEMMLCLSPSSLKP